MKVVILGAGSGSRLNLGVPKPLVHLSEQLTILDLQLRYLTHVVRVDDILVVIGFRSDLIVLRYPYLRFAHNGRYAHTNTAASLRVGFDAINEDDVLWLNGDVVFSGDVLNDLERRPPQNLVWVSNHPLGNEEIKYTLDSEGYINKLSKTVKNGLGEGVGINFIRSEDVPRFKSCLARCADSDYFERAMELSIKMGVKFKPIDVRDRFCVEVDFEEDLQQAQAYVRVVL